MKILILNATVCDPQSALNSKKCDLLVSNGMIEDIQPSSKSFFKTSTVKSFDASGCMISPGWFDMRASLREPGLEFKETLESGAQAAAAGGFTSVACLPDTEPAMQSKADMEYVLRKSDTLPVHIFPYGAITKNRAGIELNELYDMHQAGAVAFSDGNRTITHAGVMLRAMQYAGNFGGLLMSHAVDPDIAAGGTMHEGQTSVRLGLKGIPNIAEEIMVARDIELIRYTGSALHFSHISSKGSVDLIRKAKKQGLPVTADVAVANLVFTDELLLTFDSNYKLSPPLRSKTDQKALWDGIADGTIDCIITDHQPEDTEHKDVEFEYSAPGMIQLQTAYSLLQMHKPASVPVETLVQALSINPRKILKQHPISVAKGNKAELTLFDPSGSWELNDKTNRSKSKNTPVWGTKLKGKVIAIINKDQLIKNA